MLLNIIVDFSRMFAGNENVGAILPSKVNRSRRKAMASLGKPDLGFVTRSGSFVLLAFGNGTLFSTVSGKTDYRCETIPDF